MAHKLHSTNAVKQTYITRYPYTYTKCEYTDTQTCNTTLKLISMTYCLPIHTVVSILKAVQLLWHLVRYL